MAINTDKYLLVIVEGPSDQVTLENGCVNTSRIIFRIITLVAMSFTGI